MNPPLVPDIVTGRPSLRLRWALAGSGVAIWASGVAWLLAHYFFMGQGSFGPQPSAWEPKWLALHGAAAFAILWVLGWISGTHIPLVWRRHARRTTGLTMLAFAAILVVSGYLLYYVTGDDARRVISVLHWGFGLAALPAFLLHRGRRLRF